MRAFQVGAALLCAASLTGATAPELGWARSAVSASGPGAPIAISLEKLRFPKELLKGQKATLLSAHQLTSPESKFGGLSGMLLEGERLYLVGDRSIWIEALADRGEDGAVVKINSARFGPIRGARGRNLRGA